MLRQIHIVDGGRVQIDRMETLRGAVDHLQPRLVLDGQVDEQRPMCQVAETLFEKADYYKPN